MNININKDFEKHYKDDAWRGFTLKEVCCMLLFLILLFGMVFFCWKWLHMQPDLAVYLAVPFGLPVLCVGFLKYQGMTPVELVKEMVFEYRTKFLLYDAEEVPEPQIFTMDSIIHSGIDRKEWKRLRKKHKKRKGQ